MFICHMPSGEKYGTGTRKNFFCHGSPVSFATRNDSLQQMEGSSGSMPLGHVWSVVCACGPSRLSAMTWVEAGYALIRCGELFVANKPSLIYPCTISIGLQNAPPKSHVIHYQLP